MGDSHSIHGIPRSTHIHIHGISSTMSSDDFLFQVYSVSMLCLFFLYEKAVFGALNPHAHLPEDDNLTEQLKREYDATSEDVHKRKNRIFLNALENIPLHATIFTGAVFVVSQKNTDLSITLSMVATVGCLGVSIAAAFSTLA